MIIIQLENTMNFKKLSDQNLRGLSNLGSARADIIETRDATLSAMAAVCSNVTVLFKSNVLMTGPTSDLATFLIKSAFGSSRSVNGWHIENSQLYGTVTFERECLDKYGKTYWEPIWGFVIGHNEAPRSGNSDGALIIPIDSGFGDERDSGCRQALYAILFGIINGPVT